MRVNPNDNSLKARRPRTSLLPWGKEGNIHGGRKVISIGGTSEGGSSMGSLHSYGFLVDGKHFAGGGGTLVVGETSNDRGGNIGGSKPKVEPERQRAGKLSEVKK